VAGSGEEGNERLDSMKVERLSSQERLVHPLYF
jgi:hypothetical protein